MQTQFALSSTPFTAVQVASHRVSRRKQCQSLKVYAAERNEHTGMVGSFLQLSSPLLDQFTHLSSQSASPLSTFPI
jgi:hypothetical protein